MGHAFIRNVWDLESFLCWGGWYCHRPHSRQVIVTDLGPCCSGRPAGMNTLKANNVLEAPGVGDEIFPFEAKCGAFVNSHYTIST